MTGDAPRDEPRSYRGKRAFDLVLVLITAPLWGALLGLIAIAVRLALGSPVLFRQPRPGLHGHIFTLLKFRTMTNACGPDGALLSDGARLTRFGKMLRASSLDELPELVNVLTGDMSLVGPRPLLVRYLPLYSPEHRQRHAVRPGLTGLAQISGRNMISWPERFDLDVRYARTNSLSLDVRILSRTIAAVLGQDGISAEGESTMTAFDGYEATSTSESTRTHDPKRDE